MSSFPHDDEVSADSEYVDEMEANAVQGLVSSLLSSCEDNPMTTLKKFVEGGYCRKSYILAFASKPLGDPLLLFGCNSGSIGG